VFMRNYIFFNNNQVIWVVLHHNKKGLII